MTDGFIDDPEADYEAGTYYPIQTHVFADYPVYENNQKRCVVHQRHRFLKKEQPPSSFDLPALRLYSELEL